MLKKDLLKTSPFIITTTIVLPAVHFRLKSFSLYFMAGFYTLAGINHFLHPEFYQTIMPWWLGWHCGLIFTSGACEIVFGLLLIPTISRRIAAWCIIALLTAVFPANIQMMMNYHHQNNPALWITIVRLPIQILLAGWAYMYTKPISAFVGR